MRGKWPPTRRFHRAPHGDFQDWPRRHRKRSASIEPGSKRLIPKVRMFRGWIASLRSPSRILL
jgi:hypothetical protein